MKTDFLYEEFIMLSDDSFVSFSVKDNVAEIRPPLDSLTRNLSIKKLAKNAAVVLLTGISLTVIPPGALAKTKDCTVVQEPQIAYVADTGLLYEGQNSAATVNGSQNVSISNLATVEKVDSTSTNSSAEETSLNVVNPKSKKSNTIKKKNKDSLLKSTGKNQEKSNSAKGLLKHVKIIAVGSMEFTNLVSEQPPVNQPAGQQLTQGSPNVGPDGLEPTEQRLNEEVFILTDVNEQYSKELLYQSSEGAKGIIRDLNILDERFCEEGLACKKEGDSVVEKTTKDLQNIQRGPERERLKNTRNKAMKLAQTVEVAWETGDRICTTATKNIGIILPEAEALPKLLEHTYQVISPLRELLNSRISHVLNPAITHKHEGFAELVRHVPDLVQSFNENQNLFQVIYNLYQPEDFLNHQNPVIRYHNGILPQKIVVGVIEGQNDEQAAELAKRISGLPGHVIHACIQKALILDNINEVVPGTPPQSIQLKLPANALQNFPKGKKFPVKVWSDTSHTCVSAESLAKITPVAAVIMDKPNIKHPSAPDNVVVNNNVDNSVLKGNLLVAARLKVDTKTPNLSGLVQADLFNLNHSNASLKDRLFMGVSVDLLGAISGKNNPPWLIEVSAQKSVLSSAYRISLNIGFELGF